jgi:hypothetical protein
MKETRTIYRCDHCNNTLSDDKRISKPHLSIGFSGYSGRVEPMADKASWGHVTTIRGGIYQFCDSACLGEFVDAQEVIT